MTFDHTTFQNTDMDHAQPTPEDYEDELIVKIMSPLILPTGVVGNILIIWILFRTRARFLSFANYFTVLAVTDLLLLLLSLLPRYVEAYVHARFEVDGHLMCRLYSFMYYALLTSSSLLLAAMTTQRAASVVWPHRAKAAPTNMCSYIAICGVFVAAALLKCQVLIKGRLLYTDCYLGSRRFVSVKDNRDGYAMAWGHFVTVFMLPFNVILVSNYLLISRVNASKREARVQVYEVPQSDASFKSGNHSLLRRCRMRLTGCVRSMDSITHVLVVTSLFFCACLMPAFRVDVLITGEFVDPHSISTTVYTVFDTLVFLNSSFQFYLYCITGRGFRQELRRICTRLLCG